MSSDQYFQLRKIIKEKQETLIDPEQKKYFDSLLREFLRSNPRKEFIKKLPDEIHTRTILINNFIEENELIFGLELQKGIIGQGVKSRTFKFLAPIQQVEKLKELELESKKESFRQKEDNDVFIWWIQIELNGYQDPIPEDENIIARLGEQFLMKNIGGLAELYQESMMGIGGYFAILDEDIALGVVEKELAKSNLKIDFSLILRVIDLETDQYEPLMPKNYKGKFSLF